jgi:hypothetical protein
MIANPAIPSPVAVPHPFTLNDLRMHTSIAEAPSSTSALTLSGMVLAVVLAIGAFLWLDPLHLFTPTEASQPAPAFVPSPEPALSIERQQIITPLTPVPATKSVEVPIAPALVVQAPHVLAPVVRPRAANIKPEEKTDAPIVLKLGDDTKNAPKPAATNDQTPVTE